MSQYRKKGNEYEECTPSMAAKPVHHFDYTKWIVREDTPAIHRQTSRY